MYGHEITQKYYYSREEERSSYPVPSDSLLVYEGLFIDSPFPSEIGISHEIGELACFCYCL